jgi:hypothetical protein
MKIDVGSTERIAVVKNMNFFSLLPCWFCFLNNDNTITGLNWLLHMKGFQYGII